MVTEKKKHGEDDGKKQGKLEQDQQEKQMSLTGRALMTGFVGGIFWSLLGYVAYFLNFTKIRPSLILAPWAIGEWKDQALGDWIGIVLIGILSMGVAFLYKILLAKFKHMSAGVLYGIFLWGFVFYLLRPMFPALKPIHELGSNTLITTLCLYVLYGLFVGFSISFDHNEVRKAHHENA